MMTRTHLDVDLESIVPVQNRNLTDMTYDLIRVYVARDGGVHELMNAARAAVPGNVKLSAVVDELSQIQFDVLPMPEDLQKHVQANNRSVAAGRDIIGNTILTGDVNVINQNLVAFTSEQQKSLRTREKLIGLVEEFWVKGLLENSLQKQVLIRLGLKDYPKAVDNRLRGLTMRTEDTEYPLQTGISIAEVFDQYNDRLLILGEPGSGKTTALLELTRELLGRAKDEPSLPVPIIVNLSSWAMRREKLSLWLINEIDSIYLISKKLSQRWIKDDALVIMLDGLDEVSEAHREECVEAINTFCQEYAAPVVVCSRIADYKNLEAALRLRKAVVLQPLTLVQIQEYFGQIGDEYVAIAETIKSDVAMQELAETPLMLSIITLAFQGVQSEDLSQLDSGEFRHRHLFNLYIRRMFEHEEVASPFSQQKTIHWLSWLAGKMYDGSQSVFLLESIQPTWLTPARLFIYRSAIILIFGIIGGLIGGLFVGRDLLVNGVDGSDTNFLLGVASLLIFGLITGLIAGMSYGANDIRPSEIIRLYPPPVKAGLVIALVVILSIGLMLGLITDLTRVLGFELGTGLLLGLTFGLNGKLKSGLLFGLITGYVFRYFLVLGQDPSGIVMISTVVATFFFTWLFNKLKYQLITVDEIPVRTKVNEGIWLSVRSSLVGGLVFGQCIGMSLGLGMGLIFGERAALDLGLMVAISRGLASGLFIGLPIGLIVGLFFGVFVYGLDAFIRHFVLRLFLRLGDHAPLNYVKFLDHAAEILLLHKVSGSYIFVHRTILEYLAQLTEDEIIELGQETMNH